MKGLDKISPSTQHKHTWVCKNQQSVFATKNVAFGPKAQMNRKISLHLRSCPMLPVEGALEPNPATVGRRRGTPWTSSPLGQLREANKQSTSRVTDNSELPIQPTCMSLACGRNPEYPERTHAGPGPRWNKTSGARPSCCEATAFATAPLCTAHGTMYVLKISVIHCRCGLKGDKWKESPRGIILRGPWQY